MDEDSLESSNYYRERPPTVQRKRKTGAASSSDDTGESSSKSNNAGEVLPVVLQSQTERQLKSFNPIYIHNCLKKCIGSYESCVPLRNGNLVVTCSHPQQVKTLMGCSQLTDGDISTPIQTTLRQPVAPKGVIYNVPLDLKAAEILAYLKPKVKYVKRFQYKPVGEMELLDSTTVLLHFQSDLPSEVRIRYLNFKIRPYVPKPLRCFKCNRFGHVANHCKGKERCSKCGEQHSWTVCPSTALNCPNCHGKHAANDRSCPRYKQEEHVLKNKSSRNVSYAEAVKMHRKSAQGLSSSNLSSRSEFPPLPTVDRSPRNLCPNLSNTNAVASTGDEIIVTEEVGSFNMFQNPIHFLAFLAEVIQQPLWPRTKL